MRMKLMAIDGNSLINRAFYGVRQLSTSDGVPTNAVYGFINMLLKLREDYNPDAICVCFDRREKTFRHLAYDGYKAQRKEMPEDLAAQMPLCKQALGLMGIACLEAPGFEADDLLGTLARICKQEGEECVIATGDRDSLQFIAQGATVSLVVTRMGQTTTEDYDAALFAEKYRGLTPDKIVDLKAIMGDSSDNIPGVKGIGEKGAMDLLVRFGSLENIYQNLDDPSITASMRKKLEEGREMAFLSYDLALGRLDAPVDKTVAQLIPAAADQGQLHSFFEKLQLKSIIKRLGLTASAAAASGAGASSFAPVAAAAVESAVQLGSLAAEIATAKAVALHMNRGMDLCAVAFGSKACTIDARQVGEAELDSFISGLFCGGEARVTLHGAKPLFRRLLARGLKPRLPAMDTELAAYLLSPGDSGYSIRELAAKYMGFDAPADIYDSEDAQNLFGVTAEAAQALSCHCQLVAELGELLACKLEESGMLDLLRQMEIPLMAVLADMERLGMAVDKPALLAYGETLSADMERLEAGIYEKAGEKFNIGSPKQLGAILFDKLGLRSGKKTKTGYSTDAEVLEKLAANNPIVNDILDWRKTQKLKSTYVDGLTKVIGADGRIHSTLHQTVTTTGRLSSSEPNLQNIPVRRVLGSEIRQSFIAPNGMMLIDADYSQIELRILAHIANDAIMLDAFSRGEDIHTVTASQVFGVPAGEVTSDMRRHAKAVNFGIVYGISAFSLSDDIGVTVKEAQEYMEAYFTKYTGVKAYMDGIKVQAKEAGYVTTLFGRRRYLPELKSGNHNIRAFGERVALNTPIQGTAADIIKLAMINVHRRLEREGFKAKLILQVHDELILEAPLGELEAVSALLKEEMENAASLNVRLAVDVSHGGNWYDAKK